MSNFNLKGGVISIGSLFWETEKNCINKEPSKKLGKYRRIWREDNFEKESIDIQLPIRYGRKSHNRCDTYTMVFSNSLTNPEYGNGKVLKYQRDLKSFEELFIRVIELAISEGIYKEKSNRRIISNWGSVALVLNNKLQKSNKGLYEYITIKWSHLFSKYRNTLNPKNYRVDKNEYPTIDLNGMLTIDLEDKMGEFDFLLATPVEINVPMYPLGKDIADTINKFCYLTYFFENQNHGIVTKDDKIIIDNLKEKYKQKLN